MATVSRKCEFCHAPDVANRCSKCKKAYYCDATCQKKDWKLGHKKDCKKRQRMSDAEWSEYEHCKLLTQLQTMTNDTSLTPSELESEQKFLRQFYQMKATDQSMLLFPVADIDVKKANEEDLRLKMTLNSMFQTIFSVFDRDNDKKLNFEEWRTLLRELSLDVTEYPGQYHGFLRFVLQNYLNQKLPEEKVSGDDESIASSVKFGVQEVMATLRAVAAIYKENGILTGSNVHATQQPSQPTELMNVFERKLVKKLFGHALSAELLGEPSKEDIYEILQNAIPIFNDDVISIIYNYHTMEAVYLKVGGWHRINWLSLDSDLKLVFKNYSLSNFTKKTVIDEFGTDITNQVSPMKEESDGQGDWEKSDKKYQYDLFYLMQTDEKGYSDIYLMFQVCGKDFEMARMLDIDADKCCIGMCQGYIPQYSFDLADHAELIGKVLEFHRFDAHLCRSLYIGKGLLLSKEKQRKVVKHFNRMYSPNTLWKISDYDLVQP